jgi:hypothetical protein
VKPDVCSIYCVRVDVIAQFYNLISATLHMIVLEHIPPGRRSRADIVGPWASDIERLWAAQVSEFVSQQRRLIVRVIEAGLRVREDE